MTAAALPLGAERASNAPTTLGIATTSYMIAWRPHDTYEFLEHCHNLGAAGIQSAINGDIPKIRKRADDLGMYIEAMVPMPKGSDTSEFEKGMQDAKEVGAVAVRSACLGTRRYETFKDLASWQAHVAEAHASIEAARPILDRFKIPLGLENHKDWTADELAAVMKQYSSEYFGVCLDFGNNISLLDEPMSVIEKLAPYAICTHLKDMAVEANDDGFLLSEVLLGTGYLDLAKAVSTVRRARSNIRFTLEMITRDPLKVPCLLDPYWVTFPDRNGIHLARTLKFVQTHQPFGSLPKYSQLSHEQHSRQEDQNVVACMKYAKENLGI